MGATVLRAYRNMFRSNVAGCVGLSLQVLVTVRRAWKPAQDPCWSSRPHYRARQFGSARFGSVRLPPGSQGQQAPKQYSFTVLASTRRLMFNYFESLGTNGPNGGQQKLYKRLCSRAQISSNIFFISSDSASFKFLQNFTHQTPTAAAQADRHFQIRAPKEYEIQRKRES